MLTGILIGLVIALLIGGGIATSKAVEFHDEARSKGRDAERYERYWHETRRGRDWEESERRHQREVEIIEANAQAKIDVAQGLAEVRVAELDDLNDVELRRQKRQYKLNLKVQAQDELIGQFFGPDGEPLFTYDEPELCDCPGCCDSAAPTTESASPVSEQQFAGEPLTNNDPS